MKCGDCTVFLFHDMTFLQEISIILITAEAK